MLRRLGSVASSPKEGWLHKQSGGKAGAWTTGNLTNRWQQRYFKITDDKLEWFASGSASTPNGSVDCKHLAYVRREPPESRDSKLDLRESKFTVKCGERELRLKAADDADADAWVQAIQEAAGAPGLRTQKLKESEASVQRRKLILPHLKETVRSLEAALDEAKQALMAFDGDEDIALANDRCAQYIRVARRHSAKSMSSAVKALDRLVEAGTPTSRAGYLRSLPQLLKPPAANCQWEDEWPEAYLVNLHCNNALTGEMDVEWVKKHHSVEIYKEKYRGMTKRLMAGGLSRTQAEALSLLIDIEAGLGHALRRSDPSCAASIYAITDALAKQATLQQGVAPKLYAHLRGDISLSVSEPKWEKLLEADHTGFQGFSCLGLVQAFSNDRARGLKWKLIGSSRPTTGTEIINPVLATALLTKQEFSKAERDAFKMGSVREHSFIQSMQGDYFQPEDLAESLFREGGLSFGGDIVHDSPVVCFESQEEDENGLHTAIMIASNAGIFPPNTLFRLMSKADSFESRGVIVHQPLYTVSATYRPPLSAGDGGALGSKMCGSAITLMYGDRNAYIAGLEDILARPLLTLEQEFTRDFEFTDWQGATHTLQQQWAYVTGPAQRADMTHGARDANNDGKTPEAFKDQVNAFIRARRDASEHGGSLPEAHAYLTVDEILAVRLYSGPCFQPINEFLRQVGTLRGEFRTELARHPGLTYTCVVRQLCFAIRKLAAVTTDEEASMPLWRGVRGTLPKSFWVPDDQRMVCATDTAFMSTSLTKETPIGFMREGDNVLWELLPRKESDSAFHRGADITMLSQYEKERECLFPPCTLLLAQRRPVQTSSESGRASSSAEATPAGAPPVAEPTAVSPEPSTVGQNLRKPWQTEDGVGDEEGKVKFLAIKVVPAFI